jgi:hypothetical protein
MSNYRDGFNFTPAFKQQLAANTPGRTRPSAYPSSPSGSGSVPFRMQSEKYFISPPKLFIRECCLDLVLCAQFLRLFWIGGHQCCDDGIATISDLVRRSMDFGKRKISLFWMFAEIFRQLI